MGSTFKYAPKQRSTVTSQSSYAERPTYSVEAEDVFDDPSILDELAEANASLTDRNGSTPTRRPARLPPVDAFDLEEACRAKSLAHRFGPPGYDRESYAEDPLDGPDDVRGPDLWQPALRSAAPRGSRRAFFWGFCTSLAIVIAVPAVLGYVLPLNSTPPTAISDDMVHAVDASQAESADSPAIVEVVTGDPEANETVVIRNEPAAAAIIGPAPTAFAAPLAPAAGDGDHTRALAAVQEVAADRDARVAQPDRGGGALAFAPPAADRDPVAEAEPTDGAAPEIAAAPPSEGAPPDNAGDDFTRMAQSQLSASADPSETEAFDRASHGLVSGGEQSLSAEQIDRLLARGETLLRSGNIVSARMLFLHVAAAGDPRGAKAVGMTYDPEVYARLPVTGLTPDKAQAQTWYDKAGDDTAYTIDLTSDEASTEEASAEEASAESVDEEEMALRQRHAACARKYVSYDPDTGRYTAHSGTKRPCQLP